MSFCTVCEFPLSCCYCNQPTPPWNLKGFIYAK